MLGKLSGIDVHDDDLAFHRDRRRHHFLGASFLIITQKLVWTNIIGHATKRILNML